MSDFGKKDFNLSGMRDKVKASRDNGPDIERMFEDSVSWQAVSQASSGYGFAASRHEGINFSGKVLRGGKYAGEDLSNANFSASDLKEADFSKARLRGADFSGADLSGADLSGANLDGAVFSGARLRGTNFTGASMNGVLLVEADIQDAILLDVQMDKLALEEMQSLVEYLAVYYPHKINLSRMNLTLLDFSRIDLSQVNLRGVDFTGVDFTGVNIFDLDLSECIISPMQIAQALGRMPTPLELKKIMAPKKKGKSMLKAIDFSALFDSRGTAGVWDLSKHPGITVAELLKMGKQIYNAVITKPDPKDEEILRNFQKTHDEKQDALAKEHNAEMRKVIEERKRAMLNGGAEIERRPPRLERENLDYESRQQERERELMLAREKYRESSRPSRDESMLVRIQNRGGRER